MVRRRALAAAGLTALALLSAGCVRGCTSSRPPIHINPNMDWQPKLQAQEQSEFFRNGQAMREPVEGTVAIESAPPDEAWLTGRSAGAFVPRIPLPVDEALLARGEERFGIYCRPCHDKQGTGIGILYERGRVPTPSFHEQRIVDLADGEIFDVITHGKGLMPSYSWPVPTADRWAIVAWVRHLQSQNRPAPAEVAAVAPAGETRP